MNKVNIKGKNLFWFPFTFSVKILNNMNSYKICQKENQFWGINLAWENAKRKKNVQKRQHIHIHKLEFVKDKSKLIKRNEINLIIVNCSKGEKIIKE